MDREEGGEKQFHTSSRLEHRSPNTLPKTYQPTHKPALLRSFHGLRNESRDTIPEPEAEIL